MRADRLQLVMDTNALVRGVANSRSASGKILELCRNRMVPLLLSRPVIAEYRKVLSYEDVLRRNPDISPLAVELILRRLRYVSEFHRQVTAQFGFARDPRDEDFIELAIEGRATHIVTYDRDLLSLRSEHTDAAKRFRQRLPDAAIVTSEQFLTTYEGLRSH